MTAPRQRCYILFCYKTFKIYYKETNLDIPALLYVHFNFAIILMGKRELVALLSLSSWCLVVVVWLIFAVPWVCLKFVIVVFPYYFW